MVLNSDKNPDRDFEYAVNLCSNTYTKQELLKYLKDGNITERQYAALAIEHIDNEEDADIFISNLTGCDGKIREAIAFKLLELVKNGNRIFSKYPEIFAKATIDINANISRNIIDSLQYFAEDKMFGVEYIRYINSYIFEAFEELDHFVFRDKKYVINKQLFKLYWCLEGINILYKYYKEDELYDILVRCSNIQEYTIREKVALILKQNFSGEKFKKLKKVLKQDTNYYVREILR